MLIPADHTSPIARTVGDVLADAHNITVRTTPERVSIIPHHTPARPGPVYAARIIAALLARGLAVHMRQGEITIPLT